VIIRLILLLLVLGISTGFIIDHAEGFIEIKKYKVINSPKVCGDKMCSEIDEKRAKKGLSSHNIEICGDKLCYEIKSKQARDANESSPYGQFRQGIALDLIECKQGQKIVIKKITQFPACVDMKSAEKLREKGWAVSENDQEEIFIEISNNRIKNDELNAQKVLEVSLSVVTEEINNQRCLMDLDGIGYTM
jgi:hypothetical protein